MCSTVSLCLRVWCGWAHVPDHSEANYNSAHPILTPPIPVPSHPHSTSQVGHTEPGKHVRLRPWRISSSGRVQGKVEVVMHIGVILNLLLYAGHMLTLVGLVDNSLLFRVKMVHSLPCFGTQWESCRVMAGPRFRDKSMGVLPLSGQLMFAQCLLLTVMWAVVEGNSGKQLDTFWDYTQPNCLVISGVAFAILPDRCAHNLCA